MDVSLELNKLYTNRLMRTEDEIYEFELALERLIRLQDFSIIDQLCYGFDDDTEHHEVMFGLVHGIEFLYQNKIEEGLQLIALSVPKIINQAREWVEILHFRILNHPQVRLSYSHVLSLVDDFTRNEVIKLLTEIKAENTEQFGGSVDEVIGRISV